MADVSRRKFVTTSAALVSTTAVIALGTWQIAHAASGFMAASSGMQDDSSAVGPHEKIAPGIQKICALCEVTGGGQKVYGIAIEYDATINPTSLHLNTYTASVFPAAKGFFAGMPQEPDKNNTTAPPQHKALSALYTSNAPALRSDQKSIAGKFVIVEFSHDADLSLPTTDSDKVALTQDKNISTTDDTVYRASPKVWSNAGHHGNNVAIRGVDGWEQNHWWWDDSRSAWLEYSIYLPQSFLEQGGETKSYPLLLAVTHSGTSYDGTCAQTLTEQCIASIWSLPEEQAQHECVVITPRYERTTLNDYWEHTFDVENTYRLVESLLSNTWNYGNPNRNDRRDKVLKIDPRRVYCTGWSMGAMTSLWLMSKHPNTFAAGLIIAGQQRPTDVVPLAHQKVLIITGTEDNKATPWNEDCIPLWEQAGGKVVRPKDYLDPGLIFPIEKQQKLTAQINSYLAQKANITFLTFQGVDHMGSARKFFHIQAARDWLLSQVKA